MPRMIYSRGIWIIVALITAISAWILGIKMKRKIKRALGITVDNEVELTSLNTWMRVEDVEEQRKGGKMS